MMGKKWMAIYARILTWKIQLDNELFDAEKVDYNNRYFFQAKRNSFYIKNIIVIRQMSTTLNFISDQIIIYGATPLFVAGVTRRILNTLVFLSLRTFRQSSCAFYLTIMSIFDVCSLFRGLFHTSHCMAFMDVDGTETSLFYCECRLYFSQVSIETSLVCSRAGTVNWKRQSIQLNSLEENFKSTQFNSHTPVKKFRFNSTQFMKRIELSWVELAVFELNDTVVI